MAIEKVLVIDEDVTVCQFLSEILHNKGFEVETLNSALKALKLLNDSTFDLIITGMRFEDSSGLDILRKVKETSPQTIVFVITAFGSIENSVEAMRLGAFTYLLKPFSADAILAAIEKAKQHITLVAENSYLRHQLSSGGGRATRKIIAESPLMKQILTDVEQIAKSNANLFITGESGTGKEVIAHTVHYQSHRAHQPFIKVNCAAIPETLIESEFFGHEKGAFTGANTKHLGRFELANAGTLLLDEVTEIPIGLQAKLLRAIQEQEFERVGGTKPVKVDVRLISTSNRNLQEALEQGLLRKDLYYRLNVVPLHLPSLRDRRDDIIPLAEYFLEKTCIDNNKAAKHLSEDGKKALLDYPWPGNIRELANIIERAVVLTAESFITHEHLRLDQTTVSSLPTSLPVGLTLEELEKRMIIETLQHHKDDQAKTAESLGITLKKLQTKLEALNPKESHSTKI